jgi:crossover junction endodeoxyribonuclease RusA
MAKELTLPYPPQANHLYTIARGRKILSTKGREYKQNVGMTLHSMYSVEPLTGDVVVTLTAYRPRKAGDLDNVLKVVLDSLKGLLWLDDKQVVEIHAYRKDDKTNPRIEIQATLSEQQNGRRG